MRTTQFSFSSNLMVALHRDRFERLLATQVMLDNYQVNLGIDLAFLLGPVGEFCTLN
jgi:hypothetical protein